jgi:hypothetical protein
MKYYCRECKKAFESDEPRCPACMRKTTVIEGTGEKTASASPAASMSLFRGPGLLVTIVILVPLIMLNNMEWHYGWWFTFVAALFGFGAGHLVNWFWHKRKAGK